MLSTWLLMADSVTFFNNISVAGYLFGWAVVTTGILIGAVLSFFISIHSANHNPLGRYILREFLKELLFDRYKVFMAIDSVMTQEVRLVLFDNHAGI